MLVLEDKVAVITNYKTVRYNARLWVILQKFWLPALLLKSVESGKTFMKQQSKMRDLAQYKIQENAYK